MDQIQTWLTFEENRRFLSYDHYEMAKNILDHRLIAIRGSAVFPITYGFLANILSITVTFFIICMQT